ncbi:recombinase family protein [Geovibrio sp. ADMFC3]
MNKYVGYFRVSTKKQDYGLDAQRAAVENFIQSKGGEIVSVFSEKESGKNAERPELKKAIEQCKKTGANLIIAKLDRLSREVAFLFNLKAELDRAGVGIVCCDLPDLNTLTLGIFATMAQHERELISKRTKEGLAVARAKGKKIGASIPVPEPVRKSGNEAMKKKSVEYYQNIKKLASKFRQNGMTYKEIALFLNDTGHKTVLGSEFQSSTVYRILGKKRREYPKPLIYQIRKMYENGSSLTEIAKTINNDGYKTITGKKFQYYTVKQILRKYCGINKKTPPTAKQ